MMHQSIHHTKHREGDKKPLIDIPYDHPLVKDSIVRHNLLIRDGYAPYCGNGTCMNRVSYNMNTGLAKCQCGWESSKLPPDFINLYKRVWGLT